VLPLKVQTERFFKIRDSIVDSLTLTYYVDIKAPRHIPRCFMCDCNSELHTANRTSGLRH